jgi:hypothetical protein
VVSCGFWWQLPYRLFIFTTSPPRLPTATTPYSRPPHLIRFHCVAIVLLQGDTGAQQIAQVIEPAEKKSFDLSRTALVASYVGGSAALFWHPYYAYLDRAFGSAGISSVVGKVALDNFVGLPFLDIPAFTLLTTAPRVGMKAAWTTLQEEYANLVLCGWAIWIPSSAVVFWKCPTHLRLPVFCFIDATWSCVLSFISNRTSG